MPYVAGIDLGGTAINYTIADTAGTFLIDGLCEHPSRTIDGPRVCLDQVADGLAQATARAGIRIVDLVAVGLDTPGPASANGVLSAIGSTNFSGGEWMSFDIRGALEQRLHLPVVYINDGNAAALWGHTAVLGHNTGTVSVTAVIGTGLGGGIVVNGRAIVGSNGFGGELGHVLLPTERISGIQGLSAVCNCGRVGDLESLCSLTAIRNSLLPWFLRQHPDHMLATMDVHAAASLVRGMAEAKDPMCRAIFRVQAQALGLFFDQMVNVFDPDALIVGGGAVETSPDFREWFIGEVRASMPAQRAEQASIPIVVMPDGDSAGARGAAIEALRELDRLSASAR